MSPATKSRPVPAVKQCCQVGNGETAGEGSPVIALVGAPNVGKSTLFNALTGSRVTMGNWPGTTVEVSRGVWRYRIDSTTCDCDDCDGTGCVVAPGVKREATVIDFPGAYSLDSQSPDEELTRQLIADCPPEEAPDLIVAVVDAAHLTRSLYLVAELREQSRRMVVAITMGDFARRHGIEVDTYALSEALGVPVVSIDPRRRQGMDNLTRTFTDALSGPMPAPRSIGEDMDQDQERFLWVCDGVEKGTTSDGLTHQQFSDKIDRIILAPVLGPLIFLVVMWIVFQVTTTVAAPLQDGLDTLFSGPVSDGTSWLLDKIGLGGTWVEGLLINGLISGVGALLSFAPLVALMFILLSLLEDSGYLARAAVLTDRFMAALGLPGKAFLPLVVGFGCNVPAMAATRILSTPKQRLMTIMLIPFTCCPARFTVFAMLGSIFFGRWAGTAIFVMYIVSILLVIGGGLILRKTLWRDMVLEPLVIDLPPYQVPTVRLTASVTWVRLKGFLKTASGIIVGCVIAVWLLQAIPVDSAGTFGHVGVEDSLYAWLAKAIAPLFAPAGFGAWQTVSALIVGFVAKEAVISSWGQTYAVADGSITALGDHIRVAFEVSSGGHTMAAVAAFMVFLLAYTPCVATLAAQKREVGWKWTGFGVLFQLAVASVLAIIVFQVGRLFL